MESKIVVDAAMANLPSQISYIRDQNSPVIVYKHNAPYTTLDVYQVFICLIQNKTRCCYSAEIWRLNDGKMMTVDDIYVYSKSQIVQSANDVAIYSTLNPSNRHRYPLEYVDCILSCM